MCLPAATIQQERVEAACALQLMTCKMQSPNDGIKNLQSPPAAAADGVKKKSKMRQSNDGSSIKAQPKKRRSDELNKMLQPLNEYRGKKHELDIEAPPKKA